MSLVFFVAFSLTDREGVAEDVENLQILEFCLFVGAPAEIGDDFFEGPDLVVSDRENVEFGAIVEPIKYHDAVVIQR